MKKTKHSLTLSAHLDIAFFSLFQFGSHNFQQPSWISAFGFGVLHLAWQRHTSEESAPEIPFIAIDEPCLPHKQRLETGKHCRIN